MAEINMGVVGLGGIAQGMHLPGIKRSPDLNLTAVCDIDKDQLNRIGDRFGIESRLRFTDYRELIAAPEVAALSICTPNDCHFPIALAAADAGKPFALEKPITLNAAQAETLAERIRQKNVKNMVCFSYRFITAARYARSIVQSGHLGTIYHVYVQYLQSLGLPGANAPLVWRFDKKRAGSGALGDLGCHVLDLVHFITGKNYTKVIADADTYIKERKLLDGSGTGVSDVDDYCHYLVRMEEGISANFLISRFAFGRGNFQRLEIYGSKGALVYKLDEKPGQDELELCIGEPMGSLKTFSSVPVPKSYAADQMQSFADVIKGQGDGTAATIEDGLANQKVLDALIKSFENESWVSLK